MDQKKMNKQERKRMVAEALSQMTKEQKEEYMALKEKVSKMTIEEKKAAKQNLEMEQMGFTPEQMSTYEANKVRVAAMTDEEKDNEVKKYKRRVLMNSKAEIQAKIDALSPEDKADLDKKKEDLQAVVSQLGINRTAVHCFMNLFQEMLEHPKLQTKEEMESNLVHVTVMTDLLKRSNLDKKSIKQIWKLADLHKRKALDHAEFLIAVVNISKAQNLMPLNMEKAKGLMMPQFETKSQEASVWTSTSEKTDISEQEENKDDDEMPSLEWLQSKSIPLLQEVIP